MAIKKKGDDKVLEVNATMQGELTFKDSVNLTINGNFQGKLDTKGTLIVGKDAYVGAEIIGEDITIAGKVEGNIIALKRLTLISPANVKGEIKTPVLVVEEGAILNGECIMRSEKAKFLTLEEMAAYLKVDRETLLNWVEDNKIPVMREGSKYLFDRKEVENWLSKEKVS
ncbi:MAG: polymer-forming cytoskeletal protein [Candidatus Kaelpia aquatica]|nr:polymer-forming cytoskeletal protein [Candidatus Kaelpia aquatica]